MKEVSFCFFAFILILLIVNATVDFAGIRTINVKVSTTWDEEENHSSSKQVKELDDEKFSLITSTDNLDHQLLSEIKSLDCMDSYPYNILSHSVNIHYPPPEV